MNPEDDIEDYLSEIEKKREDRAEKDDQDDDDRRIGS